MTTVDTSCTAVVHRAMQPLIVDRHESRHNVLSFVRCRFTIVRTWCTTACSPADRSTRRHRADTDRSTTGRFVVLWGRTAAPICRSRTKTEKYLKSPRPARTNSATMTNTRSGADSISRYGANRSFYSYCCLWIDVCGTVLRVRPRISNSRSACAVIIFKHLRKQK